MVIVVREDELVEARVSGNVEGECEHGERALDTLPYRQFFESSPMPMFVLDPDDLRDPDHAVRKRAEQGHRP